MYVVVSKEKLDNVKRNLFGLQKQANVINESVVKIVAGALADRYSEDVLDDELTVMQRIEEYLNEVITMPADTLRTDKDLQLFIMLTAGEQSYANALQEGPKYVSAEQPSPDSPKCNFRIMMLGTQPEKEDVLEVGRPHSDTSTEIKGDKFSYRQHAEELKQTVIGIAPQSMKDELGDDEWALALCAAEYYFKL